jgi:hypothetical protein
LSTTADRPWERPFDSSFGDETWHGDRLWDRSANFTLRSSFEDVILEGRDLARPVYVSNGQGDPAWATLDGDDEKWCAIAHEGLVLYRLAPPWRDYEFPPRIDHLPFAEQRRILTEPPEPNDQWWQIGRDLGRAPVDFDMVEYLGGGRFEAIVNQVRSGGGRWIIDTNTRAAGPAPS